MRVYLGITENSTLLIFYAVFTMDANASALRPQKLMRELICFAQHNAMRSSSASSSSSLQLDSSNDKIFWGCFFVAIGSIFFVGFLFAAVISKLLPPSNNSLISAIQNDWYYCFLVPLTLPVLVVAVYFHWLSMKMFKHA